VDAKKKEIMDRWIWVSQQPAGNPQLDTEFHHLMTIVAYPGNPDARYVRDEISEITSIRTQVEQQFASRGPVTVDPGMAGLIKDIQSRYAELAQNAEVIGLLEKAGGNLAEAPKVPEAARDTNALQEPVANYEELKGQLTDLEKETKLALGTFRKKAKGYLEQKKELVKRIKKGEGLITKRSKFQDSLPDGEQKTKFGLETEAKYIKPLNDLKAKLQNLRKPNATAIEKNFKEAKQLLEQIQGLPEYAANPKSIDSLAEKIANYRNGRNGYETQQTKMAK